MATQKYSQPLRIVSNDTFQRTASQRQRYQWQLMVVGCFVALGVVGSILFWHYQSRQDSRAQKEMFQAVYFFEQEDFQQALQGDGACVGFLDIVKDYRFTPAANLAHFYIGVISMHQKDYARAIYHLLTFKAKRTLLQSRAWALIGDAYAEQQQYKLAIQYYMKATNHRVNEALTPIYWVKMALVHEASQNFTAALDCYQRMIHEFPDAMQYGEIQKHVARLKTLQASPHP